MINVKKDSLYFFSNAYLIAIVAFFLLITFVDKAAAGWVIREKHLFATSVTNPGDWTSISNAIGQTDAYASCPPDDTTNLKATSMDAMPSLPSGAYISNVRANVKCRYDNNTTGRVELKIVPYEHTLISPEFTTTNYNLELRMSTNGDMSTAPDGSAWTVAKVNALKVWVKRRVRDNGTIPNNTTLRVALIKLVVTYHLPDHDNDGIPDDEDPDDDNDGIPDVSDNCPRCIGIPDYDGDTWCDIHDPDIDNDGVPNAQDQDDYTTLGVPVDASGIGLIKNLRTNAEYSTINNAIAAAGAGDIIQLRPWTYGTAIAGGDRIIIKKPIPIHLKSFSNNPENTIINGLGIAVDAANTIIEGVTVANNSDTGIIAAEDCVIKNCIIKNNVSDTFGGGGIYGYYTSKVSVYDTFIEGNSSKFSGGGMYCEGECYLMNCVVRYNSSDRGDGGGLYANGVTTMIDTDFIGNESSWMGGGGHIDTDIFSVENCRFIQNMSGFFGGGLSVVVEYNPLPSRVISIGNSVFSQNQCQGVAAGLGIESTSDDIGAGKGEFRLLNCSFGDNRAANPYREVAHCFSVAINQTYGLNDTLNLIIGNIKIDDSYAQSEIVGEVLGLKFWRLDNLDSSYEEWSPSVCIQLSSDLYLPSGTFLLGGANSIAGNGTLWTTKDTVLKKDDHKRLFVNTDIRGTGNLDIDYGTILLQGNCTINLSGSKDDRFCSTSDDVGSQDGAGRIKIYPGGALLVQDSAKIHDTEIEVYNLNVNDSGQSIVYNDITLKEATAGYGGQFFVEDNCTISCNRIFSEGDRYLDMDPDPLDGIFPTIENNRIYVTINEGQLTEKGTLLELRAGDYTGLGHSGAYYVPEFPDFSGCYADNWVLEELTIQDNAKLNLTNRLGFTFFHESNPNVNAQLFEHTPETVYIKTLKLGENAVLNTGLQTLYYQRIEDLYGNELDYDPASPYAPLANGARFEDIPLLGFSLAIIAMDDTTSPPHDEFTIRVQRRLVDPADPNPVLPLPPVYLGRIQRIDLGENDLDGRGGGAMLMAAHDPSAPNSASSVAAKGAFARAGDEDVLVEFEYLFLNSGDMGDAEIIVYMSDRPDVGSNLVELARLRPPAWGRPGSIGSNEFAVFSGIFPRGTLNFKRGTYIELELRGKGSSVLIDNWDPQIRCGVVCGDYGGIFNINDFQDYLLLLSEIGLGNPLQVNKGCLDMNNDNVVDIDDLLAWDLNGTSLCNPAMGLIGTMDVPERLSAPRAAGVDPNGIGLVLFGRQEGDGTGYAMPNNAFYGLDPNGLAHALQTAPAGGRLLTDRDGRLFQVRGKDGIFDVQTGICVVAPALLDDVKIAGVGNPITDAAFDPHDSDVLYVVPVLVDNAYKAAARLRLTGDGAYTIEQVYGGDPSSNPVQSITITDPNHTMSVLYEPDTQNVREIEVDSYGNLYVLSSYRGNRNDWLLMYRADNPDHYDYINLTDMGIQSPSGMTMTSNGRLFMTTSFTDPDDFSAVLYAFDAHVISPVSLRTFKLSECPHPDISYGLGYKAVITAMTEDIAAGKLYAVGFTSPFFHPDANWTNEIGLRKIFTTPFIMEFDLAAETSVVYPIVDAASQRVALPISVTWKGTVSGPQDPCEGADIDGSGAVDLGDLVILASQWLQTPGIPSADIMPLGRKDNFVDILDFQKLAELWHKTGCLQD